MYILKDKHMQTHAACVRLMYTSAFYTHPFNVSTNDYSQLFSHLPEVIFVCLLIVVIVLYTGGCWYMTCVLNLQYFCMNAQEQQLGTATVDQISSVTVTDS